MLTPCVTRNVVRPPRVAGHSHQPPAASSRSATVTSARRTTLPPSRSSRDATSVQAVRDVVHPGHGEMQAGAVVGRLAVGDRSVVAALHTGGEVGGNEQLA